MCARRRLWFALGTALALFSGGCGGGSTSGGPTCKTADACPGVDDFCKARICEAGTCGFSYTAEGTALPSQTPGDCLKVVCDGAGSSMTVTDDTNVPVDGNDCTADLCTGGVPSNPPLPAETPCGTGLVCDGKGDCVGCVVATDCPGADTTCQWRTCDSGTCGFATAADGTTCDDGDPDTVDDVCTGGVCAGTNLCAGVTCTAQDQCHLAGTCDYATGICSNPTQPDGTACDDGNPETVNDVCTAGVCAGVNLCAGVTCTAQDQCHLAGTCSYASGACSNPAKPDGTACTGSDICMAYACATGACQGIPLGAGTSCGSGLACDGQGECYAAPNVVSTTPADGSQAVASTQVVITFDQPMDPTTLTVQQGVGACTGSIQVSVNGFSTCMGFTASTPDMSSGGTVATLTPAPGLLINRTYQIRVTTAAAGANGLALSEEYDMATGFTTTDPLSGGPGSAWNDTGAAGEVYACVQNWPAGLAGTPGQASTINGQVLDSRYADSYQTLVTQVGFGPETSNPEYQAGWTWDDSPYDSMQGEAAQYAGVITLPLAGSYYLAFRVSLDGGSTWTYCDNYGSGSEPFLDFNFEHLSVLTTGP